MAILAVAKVRGNFRITLPKEVREHLRLKKNSELIFYSVENMKARVLIRRS
jgi:AbrB family looped-hinge helix DNA binding protein